MIDKKIQGKKNRQAGARFELKVRADLEQNGFVVDRWTNNVEIKTFIEQESTGETFIDKKDGKIIKEGKLIKAKSFMGRSRTNGFPDFIAFKSLHMGFIVQGVECKSNGYLDKEEKEKCVWLLDNQIFSKIIIASKSKERGEINYKEFLENQ